jgi:O-antigen/teichoic acid export membrane protein
LKNPITQLFGQTAVYGLGIVLPRFLNFLFLTPFYTRVFDRAAYGVITELYAYVVFLLVVLTYGMETGFFRYASKEKDRDRVYTTVLTSLLLTSVVFIAGIQLSADALGGLLGYGEHPEYIRWLAVIVGVDAFTAIPFARIRLMNRPLNYTLIRLAEVGVNIGLNVFFLVYCPRNPDNALVSMLYRPEIGV